MNNLLEWLLANYGQELMRPGLNRVKEALKDLLPTLQKSTIITIAGTNGKGETTLRLSEHLKNYKHVVWTSPHIERITERFRDEKGEIDFLELEKIVDQCHKKVVESKFQLSFYEFLFFVFCTWAHNKKPDYILLEVGLGGRLDAVNVFDADLVLLPSISRDHQEILGNRYDQILKEKLGTLRSKTTLIHFLDSQYLVERAEKYADSVGAKIISLKPMVKVPSYEFSLRNEILAGAACCFLQKREFRLEEWSKPLTFLSHRGEVRSNQCEWIFFGSHNVDGMRKLIQFLHSGTYNFSRPPYDKILIAFSKRDVKDLRVMMRMINSAKLGPVYVTVFDHPKAASSSVIEALSREEGPEFVKDIQAFSKMDFEGQRILVTGSYYFMGHFKSLSCCN